MVVDRGFLFSLIPIGHFLFFFHFHFQKEKTKVERRRRTQEKERQTSSPLSSLPLVACWNFLQKFRSSVPSYGIALGLSALSLTSSISLLFLLIIIIISCLLLLLPWSVLCYRIRNIGKQRYSSWYLLKISLQRYLVYLPFSYQNKNEKRYHEKHDGQIIK